MNPNDQALVNDLCTFAESREVVRQDQREAEVERRNVASAVVRTADAAFTQLRASLSERVKPISSNIPQPMTFADVGNRLTIELAQVAANVVYTPGRFGDALGAHPPSLELILSRTERTLGGDHGEPGMVQYRPARETEQFRSVEASEGCLWRGSGQSISSTELANYVLQKLVAYYKRNAPR